jgi:hypothetical protein
LVDATDSEPGSFVDRTLLARNPLAILEGTAIAARSLGVAESFIVVDREATSEYELITDALAAAEMAGWCEDVSIKCIRVDQSYLLRDPRALLEAAEGREALPRLYPALLDGLFSVPDRQPHELNSLPLVANQRWSKLQRPWPTSVRSWPTVPRGSAPEERRSPLVRSCAPSVET